MAHQRKKTSYEIKLEQEVQNTNLLKQTKVYTLNTVMLMESASAMTSKVCDACITLLESERNVLTNTVHEMDIWKRVKMIAATLKIIQTHAIKYKEDQPFEANKICLVLIKICLHQAKAEINREKFELFMLEASAYSMWLPASLSEDERTQIQDFLLSGSLASNA
jgi:hypothetical protein